MIRIRKAEREDAEVMMALIQELAVYEKEPEAVTVSMEEFIDSGFGDRPVWGAFLAEKEGVVIGMALYYIRYSTWKGRRLYLEDLIVTESERGNGIGKQLLDTIIAYAKEKKYSGVMWQVLERTRYSVLPKIPGRL